MTGAKTRSVVCREGVGRSQRDVPKAGLEHRNAGVGVLAVQIDPVLLAAAADGAELHVATAGDHAVHVQRVAGSRIDAEERAGRAVAENEAVAARVAAGLREARRVVGLAQAVQLDVAVDVHRDGSAAVGNLKALRIRDGEVRRHRVRVHVLELNGPGAADTADDTAATFVAKLIGLVTTRFPLIVVAPLSPFSVTVFELDNGDVEVWNKSVRAVATFSVPLSVRFSGMTARVPDCTLSVELAPIDTTVAALQ